MLRGGSSSPQGPGIVRANAGTALLYAAMAAIPLLLSLGAGRLALVWPSAGVAFALVLQRGAVLLPGVLLHAHTIERDLASLGESAQQVLMPSVTGLAGDASRTRSTIDKIRDTLGNVVSTLTPIDAAEPIHGALLLAKLDLARQAIHLQTHGLDDPQWIAGDREHLQLVVLNLIRNGIEAAGEGGTVTIALRSEHGWVEIEMADNGPGFRADLLPLRSPPPHQHQERGDRNRSLSGAQCDQQSSGQPPHRPLHAWRGEGAPAFPEAEGSAALIGGPRQGAGLATSRAVAGRTRNTSLDGCTPQLLLLECRGNSPDSTMLRHESAQARRIALVAGAFSAAIVSLPGPLRAVPINPQISPSTSASAEAPSAVGGGPRRPGMILSPATDVTAVGVSDGGPRRPGPIDPEAPSLPVAQQ